MSPLKYVGKRPEELLLLRSLTLPARQHIRELGVLTAGNIVLALKIAVSAVTVLLLVSLVALLRGKIRLHGRINTVFFILTLTALVGLEVVARILEPDLFNQFFDDAKAWTALYVHLCFSLPAALLLPFMLFTGWTHKRRAHLTLAAIFAILWTGTFITGIFFLPHQP
jgi:uncharacterized membrane protein YozB (DUF420 family)